MKKHKCVLRVKFYSKLHTLDFDDVGAKPWKQSLSCRQSRADVVFLGWVGGHILSPSCAPETIIKLLGLHLHPNAYGGVRLKPHPHSQVLWTAQRRQSSSYSSTTFNGVVVREKQLDVHNVSVDS